MTNECICGATVSNTLANFHGAACPYCGYSFKSQEGEANVARVSADD